MKHAQAKPFKLKAIFGIKKQNQIFCKTKEYAILLDTLDKF